MAAPTLKSEKPRLAKLESEVARLDSLPVAPGSPTTWRAFDKRWDDANARLAAYRPPVATPTPPPVPSLPTVPTPTSVLPTLSLVTPEVLPGERVAKVHIRLSEPARRPLTWTFYTENGNVNKGDAARGASFQAMSVPVLLLPGETERVIDIRLGRDLQPGQFFNVGLGWPTMQPDKPGGATGQVKGGTVKTPVPANPHPAPVFKTPKWDQGRKLVWETDFLGPISPNKVAGQLRTREGWGRWRNNELAPYCDASTDPGTNPHPVELVDGKMRRILRAEHVPTQEKVGAGSIDLAFSASELQTDDVYRFPPNGAMHLRFKSGRVQGTTLAAWFVAQVAGKYYEIDVVENGLGWDARGDKDNFASTVHGSAWGAEGVSLDKKLNDGQWHDLWYDETPEEMVTMLDGQILVRRPNPYPTRPPLPFIVNVSVGGITDAPRNVGPGWKSDMILDFVRFYE